MNRKIKILHLEDTPSDAELVERELKRANLPFEKIVVDTKEDFIKGLKEFSPDIILSDHTLPSFNSEEALEIVKQAGIKTPFILVTATVSEEFAVKIIQEGADDYILKDRLQRLPTAILNVIEKKELENEREKYLSELVASEARLKAAHERLLFHIENSPLGFIEWDSELRVKSWSKRAEEIFGWSEREFIDAGKTGFSQVYENDLARADEIAAQLINGVVERNTAQHRNCTKDGRVIWCEWFNSVLKNEDGKVITIMSLVQNITERKNFETTREKITADLVHRNKDLQQFTYMVSHNLRTPVANIMGLAEALQDIELDDETKQKLKENISSSAQKLDEIIKDLNQILQVRNEINEQKTRVRFAEILDDVKSGINSLAKKEDVEIKADFSEAEEIITLKTYLYSIFYNLITNSIKYRQPLIAPIIEIKSYREKNILRLTFKDNGLGIDLGKHLDQVFRLYKRFHKQAEGKGMGLFMVKTEVEMLGGTISIASAVNKGTMFTIDFDET